MEHVTSLFLQILMNAAVRGSLVESWQCVTIPWDHSSAFAQKDLASRTKKANVMASVTHKLIQKLNGGDQILKLLQS